MYIYENKYRRTFSILFVNSLRCVLRFVNWLTTGLSAFCMFKARSLPGHTWKPYWWSDICQWSEETLCDYHNKKNVTYYNTACRKQKAFYHKYRVQICQNRFLEFAFYSFSAQYCYFSWLLKLTVNVCYDIPVTYYIYSFIFLSDI